MVKNPWWLLLILFGLISCHDRPTFPVAPSISLNEFYFQKIDNGGTGFNNGDSLVIKIQFEDGDGDLGLFANQTEFPYHEYNAVIDPDTGDSVKIGDPGAPSEYDCKNFEIISKTISAGDSLVVTSDTIYVIRNPNHFNFFLTILVKEDDETFREFDPAIELNCAAQFNGRFFPLNTIGDKRPLTGELQYGIISLVGFGTYFRFDDIKLRFYIQDQALNKSNVIETEEFYIPDIIR